MIYSNEYRVIVSDETGRTVVGSRLSLAQAKVLAVHLSATGMYRQVDIECPEETKWH
jgi:hypothetical protein